MYGTIPEECDDAKKVMGEVLSLLTENGICNIICKKHRQRNFKCTIGETNVHTGKYLWDGYYKTVEMVSDDNFMIVDMNIDWYEVEMGKNHNYVEILVFVLENAPDLSSTNMWEEFVGQPGFDEISASASHDKPQKGLYA